MNADGLDVVSLAIGSPDMPPSQATIDTLCATGARNAPTLTVINRQWAYHNCARPWQTGTNAGMT
jgi:hypothetical protein